MDGVIPPARAIWGRSVIGGKTPRPQRSPRATGEPARSPRPPHSTTPRAEAATRSRWAATLRHRDPRAAGAARRALDRHPPHAARGTARLPDLARPARQLALLGLTVR